MGRAGPTASSGAPRPHARLAPAPPIALATLHAHSYSRVVLRLTAPSIVSLLVAAVGCGGERQDPPALQAERPAAHWRATALPAAPNLDAILRTLETPAQTLALGAVPLDVYPEIGRVIVYAANGDVAVLTDQGGQVRLARMPALPLTCRPTDVATDGRGTGCALMRCVMTAACSHVGSQGWTELPVLHDAAGLSSAPGAIVAWRDAGAGAFSRGSGDALVPEAGKPGFELLASGDGARTWGRIARTETRAEVLAVMATTERDVVYVTVDGRKMLVQSGLPGEGGGGSLVSAPRIGAGLGELVAGNGLVGVATIRGYELDFSWANPEPPSARTQHTIALGAPPTAVAPWDAHTLLVAVGRDLVGLDLVDGRWGRSSGRIPEPTIIANAPPGTVAPPAPAIVGVGRVGAAIVAVLADGNVLVFRGH